MRQNELHINNFKFFPKQDPNSPLLKIDGKNYWFTVKTEAENLLFIGLYTLLESALKQIIKIFEIFEKAANTAL